MRITFAIAIVLGCLTAAPSAQNVAKGSGTVPDGWHVRFDDPAAATPKQVRVEEKQDATTFTTGPAAIYYKSGMKGAGDYDISGVFSQIKTTEGAEEYGLFIAGVDLDKNTARYTTFLIRQDGKYRIDTREGADTKAVVDWTAAPPMHEPNGMKTSNTLLIRVSGNDVRFFIDGKQMHKLTRSEAGPDGVVGVRIGRDLNVQVTRLTLKKR